MRDMKRAALAMLAPLAGCNWVFGLEPTHAAPDAPDAPPPGVPVHVALLVETLDATGAPTMPAETAIPDLVRLEASTLDGQAPVPLTAAADGTVSVPMEIASKPWRLIYQRQGDDVREYQGLPAEAHVIEPLLGPVVRSPAPAGSGYVITPASYSGSHSENRVFTLGAWTEGRKALAPAGATFDYDLPSAASLSGSLATPAAGDRGLLVDYVIDGATSCIRSTGSVDFEAGMPGPPKSTPSGSWVTTQTAPTVTTPLPLIATGDVDPFGDATSRTAREQYGYLAANDLPLFTRSPVGNVLLLLRSPPMIFLRSCTLPVSGAPTVNEPAYLSARFSRVVHTEIGAARKLPGGATVVNGLAIATHGTGTFNVTSNVAFPTAVKLGGADLFGTVDNVPVARSAMPMEVTWQKTRASDVAHYWEVALYKVANSVTRERVYVTTKPSFLIMPSDLTSGTHVLEITAYSGRAPAANGDFRGVSGDQAMSVIYSRTFVVQ